MSRSFPALRSGIWLATWLLACASEPAKPKLEAAVIPASAELPPSGQQAFAAWIGGAAAPTIAWSVLEGTAGGFVTDAGLYTAPAAVGTYHVVATEPTSGASGSATVSVVPASQCWQLPVVDRVRLFPRAGYEAAMTGATIQGSNDSPTNGFVVLATISQQPAAGQWTEISIPSPAAYRYVKYYGPSGNTGSVAEVELYAGATKLSGTPFGTPGTTGHTAAVAFDGSTTTYYEGTGTADNYVGLDLADGHVVATPTITPAGGQVPLTVTLATSTSGATIRYTLDGRDPAGGTVYGAPFTIASPATLRASASKSCNLSSGIATATFTASSSARVSSIHIGNSLTDTIVDYLGPVAAAGGINLDFNRYTVPGIGTWVYQEQPTGGFGVPNVQEAVRSIPYGHLSMQPFQNQPCLPDGYKAGYDVTSLARNRHDAVNIDDPWNDAVGQAHNPGVQIWVYEAWPKTPTEGIANCITGGDYYRDPAIWNPPAPTTWEQAEANQLAFVERVRAWLVAAHPDRKPPYIVPAGRAFQKLKASVEAGTFPGVAADAFWPTFFSNGGTDNHATPIGRYYVTLVFYAVMFQRDPRDLPDTNLGTPATLTSAQAAALQALAYTTASGYALSGYAR